MNLILTAVDEELAEAWQRYCGDLDFVEIHRGSILDAPCDAVVSPANSFGFMDGGVDALYLRHFGAQIQDHVQQMIQERHHGELIVGAADVVETGHPQIPHLIVAPTMRVPMVLTDSANAFLAARAVFLLVEYGTLASGQRVKDRIQRVALPGLGTGVGKLGPNTCAHQVRIAINDVLLKGFRPPSTWAEASERHQLLYTGRPQRLQ